MPARAQRAGDADELVAGEQAGGVVVGNRGEPGTDALCAVLRCLRGAVAQALAAREAQDVNFLRQIELGRLDAGIA